METPAAHFAADGAPRIFNIRVELRARGIRAARPHHPLNLPGVSHRLRKSRPGYTSPPGWSSIAEVFSD